MVSAVHYGASKTNEAQAAELRILSRIQLGEGTEKELVHHVAQNIPRDRYVPPSSATFIASKQRLLIKYNLGGRHEELAIHPHAIRQIVETTGMTQLYASRLNVVSEKEWRRELLAYNLNEIFARQPFVNRLKEPAKFLHRIVGSGEQAELRGFLTQSYNRHLYSMPLLAAFLEACHQIGAKPAGSLRTDTKVGLQCYLPYAFEPAPGEFVAIGVWWTNSDFGDGKLKVTHTVMRANTGSTFVTEEGFSRVHLGSVVRDSDIDLGDEVAAKEVDTVCSAIKKAVTEVLSPENVGRLVAAIEKAMTENIAWDQLRGKLTMFLNKEEVGSVKKMLEEGISELPPPGIGAHGERIPTRWWASQAVAYIADKEIDQGRQSDLRQEAGKMLGA